MAFKMHNKPLHKPLHGRTPKENVTMHLQPAKGPRKRKSVQPTEKHESTAQEKEPVHSQPVSPCDDLHVRIAQRAYELHAERGYREGRALDDWLEAEREILGLECNA
jgi:hypothetical protein